MSRLSELSRTVVTAGVFTFNGVPVSASSAGATAATALSNYVQVGDAQTLTGGFVTYGLSSFSGDNSMFAVASTTDAAGTSVQFQVYYDTTPPTNAFSLGTTIAIPYVAPGSNLLVTAVNSATGRVAVVGNPYDSSIDINNGSFHVFTRPSSSSKTWTLAQSSRSAISGQELGASVAISADGTVVAVGARGPGGTNGGVFVYTYNATLNTLVQQAQLVGADAAGPDALQGTAVQISSDGKTIVSGGVNDNVGTGAVWTFKQNSSGVWAQVGSKVVPTGLIPTGAGVGQSIALSGDGMTMAVVAATNTLVLNTGCVVMYNFVDGAWVQSHTIWPLAATGNVAPPDRGVVLLNQAGDTLCFRVLNNNNGQGGTFIYNLAPSGLWINNGVARIGTGAVLNTPANSTQGCVAMSPDGSRVLVNTVSTVLNNTDSAWFWVFA